LRIRPANNGDIPAMIDLEHESPAAAHWSAQQYEAMFANRNSERPERFILVVEEADEVRMETASGATQRMLAFLVAHRVDNEWELENIVVAADSRRRGVGTRLLREFIDQARAKNGNAIFLEVRQSNQAARALYRKFGFAETGARKGYYPTPPEDAILYRLTFY
jgi:ribosomal-protein-alanine acetyltransferase